MTSRLAIVRSFSELQGSQRRIASQRAIVASFVPGSAAHRSATEVLLLLLDSAHALAEARDVLIAARDASRYR